MDQNSESKEIEVAILRYKQSDRFQKNQIKVEELLKIAKFQPESNKETFLNYFRSDRFLLCPASSNYHGNYFGGLIEHCYNVYENLVNDSHFDKKTAARVALCHDLCKVDSYLFRLGKEEKGYAYYTEAEMTERRLIEQKIKKGEPIRLEDLTFFLSHLSDSKEEWATFLYGKGIQLRTTYDLPWKVIFPFRKDCRNLGHACESIARCFEMGIKLKDFELEMIRWHMCRDSKFDQDAYSFQQQYLQGKTYIFQMQDADFYGSREKTALEMEKDG